MESWRYYKHAMIPKTAPHVVPDVTPIYDGSIWKSSGEGVPLFARWTTEFDCGYETNWWYVIRNEPFNISALKAKRRYEVNKGIKYFDVYPIEPTEYAEEIYAVSIAAFEGYPESYRPHIEHISYVKGVQKWSEYIIYGAFFKGTGLLCGWARLRVIDCCVDFMNLQANPAWESYALNAAMINKILVDYESILSNGGYVCDGERNILHNTAFQDYLEKYFGFKKAYCRLNIVYNPKYEWLIKMLYPFRKLFKKLDGISSIHKVNGLLEMEDLMREQEN